MTDRRDDIEEEVPERKPAPAPPPADVKAAERRARQARESRGRIRSEKLEDLGSAVSAQGLVCSRIELVVKELNLALEGAAELERAGSRRDPSGRRLLRDLASVHHDLSSLLARARQETDEVKKRESEHLAAHEAVCGRIDSALRSLRVAAAAVAILDRASSAGFNVEARLNRRLGVKGIIRTVSTAAVQLTRTVRLSRASAGSHSRALADLIDETEPAFE